MKTLSSIAIILLSVNLAFAGNLTPNKNANSNRGNVPEIVKASQQIDFRELPYAVHEIIPMELVTIQGEYSLYRCEAELMNAPKSCSLKGNNYHYLVYKNDGFHLSVNECNHQAVFQFFSANQSPQFAETLK